MKRLTFIKSCTALLLGFTVAGTTLRADDNGAVYTMDNSAGANHVLAFQRNGNGNLMSFDCRTLTPIQHQSQLATKPPSQQAISIRRA